MTPATTGNAPTTASRLECSPAAACSVALGVEPFWFTRKWGAGWERALHGGTARKIATWGEFLQRLHVRSGTLVRRRGRVGRGCHQQHAREHDRGSGITERAERLAPHYVRE